jgi:hypothetical protein
MTERVLYHHRKTRAQRSWIFFNMAVCCWLYIGGIFAYQHFGERPLPEDFIQVGVPAFVLASLVLLGVFMWLRKHPAVYEAIVTQERFSVHYPGSRQWSFDVAIEDIRRFEHCNTLSHAGKGIGQTGVLMKDGTFHQISMNYGNSVNDMFRAVKQANPDVTYPKKENLRVEGFLAKDYDD